MLSYDGTIRWTSSEGASRSVYSNSSEMEQVFGFLNGSYHRGPVQTPHYQTIERIFWRISIPTMRSCLNILAALARVLMRIWPLSAASSVATMERIVHEVRSRPRHDLSRSLSSSNFRKTARVMFWSSHIAERFYLCNALASMHSAVPLIIDAVMNGISVRSMPCIRWRCSKTFRKNVSESQGRLIVCGKSVWVIRERSLFRTVTSGQTYFDCGWHCRRVYSCKWQDVEEGSAKEICAYCT